MDHRKWRMMESFDGKNERDDGKHIYRFKKSEPYTPHFPAKAFYES